MSVLWIYDKDIHPNSGGTERATCLVMSAIAEKGLPVAGFLVIEQNQPRVICDANGEVIEDLYMFLMDKGVSCVINQIGYSKWLLDEFLQRGGQRWKDGGGRIISCLHFDPVMFPESISDLLRGWKKKNIFQKFRRLGRIFLLPYSRIKARETLKDAYQYLIDKSNYYVILSESHRDRLQKMSNTPLMKKIVVIRNLNTYAESIPEEMLQNKQKIALIVSRLDEPQKRISLSLVAWKRAQELAGVEGWKLQIVGDGENLADYLALVERKRIPNVEFIGRADPEQYYEAASIYLHTARREGWGLTISEAMQKGVVPVVMDSSPVFKDLIQHGINGFLARNGNIEDFANHMVSLINSPGVRMEMAAQAIESANRCDSGMIVNNWAKLIREPVDARAGK